MTSTKQGADAAQVPAGDLWSLYDAYVATGDTSNAEYVLTAIADSAHYYYPACTIQRFMPWHKPLDNARRLTAEEQRVLDTLHGFPTEDEAWVFEGWGDDADRRRTVIDRRWDFYAEDAIVAVRAIAPGAVHVWCRGYSSASPSARARMRTDVGLVKRDIEADLRAWDAERERLAATRQYTCEQAQSEIAKRMIAKRLNAERSRKGGKKGGKARAERAERAKAAARQSALL